MLENFFSFKGSISRSAYQLRIFFASICLYLCITLIDWSTATETIYPLIILIPIVWFFLATNTKRCHDLNLSLWWQFVPLYIIWLFFEKGPNKKTVSPNPQSIFSIKKKIFSSTPPGSYTSGVYDGEENGKDLRDANENINDYEQENANDSSKSLKSYDGPYKPGMLYD